jgi:hypothetical protein
MVARLITVAETSLFLRQAEKVWSRGEHDEFVGYIAGNPEAGDVIPETGGVRKVRWSREGAEKRTVRQFAAVLKGRTGSREK